MSQYAYKVVDVRKKDGSVSICVDYHEINKSTKQGIYLLPLLSEQQSKLNNCSVFCSLDIKTGYWQIVLHPKYNEKTAFSFLNQYGLFEFTAVPMDLTWPLAMFQRLMNNLLRGLDYTLVYLDDIFNFF